MHEDIEKWIMEFLSVPNPEFNGLPPCPYAKQVWLNNRVKVIDVGSDIDLYITTMIQDCMQNWPENTDVVMLVTDPELFTGKQLDEMCITASNEDYVLLWHTTDKYTLTFVQPKSELELARKTLEDQGYYKNFRKELQ